MKSKWAWDYEESTTKYYHIYSFDSDCAITFDLPHRDFYDFVATTICNWLNFLQEREENGRTKNITSETIE